MVLDTTLLNTQQYKVRIKGTDKGSSLEDQLEVIDYRDEWCEGTREMMMI